MPDNMLPEKHFPLQNLQLERTDLYTFEGDKSKPLLLFGLRGPGGMNCLWPVIELLAGEGYTTDLLIDSAAKRILETKNHQFAKQPSESPLKRIMETKPAVAVTEFSAGGGTAFPISWTEKSYNVPTVWVEDYPGVPSNFYPESLKIDPTYLCVINEATRQMAIKKRQRMNPDNIVVTGHPDYDKYAYINKDKIRKETREKLQVTDDEFLIVFSGLLQPNTSEILEQLVGSLNSLQTQKKLTLLLSKHPRDTFPEEEYDRILAPFRGKVLKQSVISSDEIGFASDLLIAPGASTEAIKSAYRRVPSVIVFTPDDASGLNNDNLPINLRSGAGEGVFSYEDLGATLHKMINDEEARQSQIRKMAESFSSDGRSAQRVASVIKRAAQIHLKETPY